MYYYLKMFSNGFTFKGNASLKEFWFAMLFDIIFSCCVQLLALPFIFDFNVYYVAASALTSLYAIIVFIPMLSLTVRRLHDVGHTGWMILITIIPLIGTIILIYLLCQPSVHKVVLVNEDFKTNNDDLYNETYVNTQNQNDLEQEYDAKDIEQNDNNTIDVENNKAEQLYDSENLDDDKQENIIVEEDKITISTPKKTRVERIRECQKLLEDGQITKEEYDKMVRKILTE